MVKRPTRVRAAVSPGDLAEGGIEPGLGTGAGCVCHRNDRGQVVAVQIGDLGAIGDPDIRMRIGQDLFGRAAEGAGIKDRKCYLALSKLTVGPYSSSASPT